MKVKELIEALKDADPEILVVLQIDEIGEKYAVLDSVDTDCIFNSGEIYDVGWPLDEGALSVEELKKKNALEKECVVLTA